MAIKPTNLTPEEEKQGYRIIPITSNGRTILTYHCNSCQYDSQYMDEPNPATDKKTRMGIIPHLKTKRHPWAFEDPTKTPDEEQPKSISKDDAMKILNGEAKVNG